MPEEALHCPLKQSPMDRFLKKLVRVTQHLMPLLKFSAVGSSHHDDGEGGVSPPNGLKGFSAIHPRHMKVEQDKCRRADLHATEGLDPTTCCHDLEALGSQSVGDGGQEIGVVIDNQDGWNRTRLVECFRH